MNQFQQAVAEVLHRMPSDQGQQPPPKSSGEMPKELTFQELAREEHNRQKHVLEKELAEAQTRAERAKEELPQAEAAYRAALKQDREERNLLYPEECARR